MSNNVEEMIEKYQQRLGLGISLFTVAFISLFSYSSDNVANIGAQYGIEPKFSSESDSKDSVIQRLRRSDVRSSTGENFDVVSYSQDVIGLNPLPRTNEVWLFKHRRGLVPVEIRELQFTDYLDDNSQIRYSVLNYMIVAATEGESAGEDFLVEFIPRYAVFLNLQELKEFFNLQQQFVGRQQ